MTVQELINKLNTIENKNKKIYVGCQGYTNKNDPTDEYAINIYIDNKSVLITDCGFYGE